uniref:(northern house mosquito) hypothetical protein n=1 Tax=Culex pipiens TaxID=7175 RepID=A0A8D8NZ10_CULPI
MSTILQHPAHCTINFPWHYQMLFSRLAEKYPVRIPLPHSLVQLSKWLTSKILLITPRRDRGHFLVIIVRHRRRIIERFAFTSAQSSSSSLFRAANTQKRN